MSVNSLRSKRLATLYLLALACASTACNGNPQNQQATRQDVLLQTLSIDTAHNETLDLVIAPCTAAGCPLQLKLLQAGKPEDTATLDWPTTSQAMEQTPISVSLGASLPLTESVGTAWFTGQEETGITVAIERIEGNHATPLILVHQQSGYEHVKRRHYLYTIKAHRLQRLWVATEGAGPHWLTLAAHAGELYYYDGFYEPGLAYNPLKIYRLTLSAEGKVTLGVPPKLYAVSVGPFAKAGQAVERQGASECLYEMSVLPSAQLGLAPGKAVLAVLTPDPDAASAGAARLKNCLGDASPQRLIIDPVQFNKKAFSP